MFVQSFVNISRTVSDLRSGLNFVLKIKKGHHSAKTESGVTVLLCTSADDVLS